MSQIPPLPLLNGRGLRSAQNELLPLGSCKGGHVAFRVLLCLTLSMLHSSANHITLLFFYHPIQHMETIGHVSLFSRPFIKGAIRDVTFYDVIKPTCVRRS